MVSGDILTFSYLKYRNRSKTLAPLNILYLVNWPSKTRIQSLADLNETILRNRQALASLQESWILIFDADISVEIGKL